MALGALALLSAALASGAAAWRALVTCMEARVLQATDHFAAAEKWPGRAIERHVLLAAGTKGV